MLLKAPDVRLAPEGAGLRAALALGRRLGDSKVDTSPEGRAAHARDESDAEGRLPDAVVHAETAEDVAAVLAVAEAHEVPVTPRAAGTGRTGGAVPAAGGLVLSTTKLARIKEIDRGDLVAVVEPGVVLGSLYDAVEAEGLFYPPDPNSWKDCTVGGNVAENAGGPRAFKYGVTRDYVLGLTSCLVGGRVVASGRRTPKGVTGYDVTSLLVGSEGTLAVFTEVTLRLVRKPEEIGTVLALYADTRAAALAVQRVVGAGIVPRCLELLDTLTLEAVRRQGVAVDARAGALLLVEVDGRAGRLDDELARLAEALGAGGSALDLVAAQDAAQRTRLWEARSALSRATRKLSRHKLSEDVVVPRSKLVALLDEVDRIGEETAVRHLTYGHAGDGNMHVNFLWDDDEERPRVDDAILRLMQRTVALSGTLSGEHGIGLSKARYLSLEQSSALIGIQEDLKRVFDPKGLLNPGKIFPTGHRAC